MAVAKFGLKLYQVNFGSAAIKINIKEGDTAVVSDLEITSRDIETPQEVVWTGTADLNDAKTFTVEVTNDSDADVSGWIGAAGLGHLIQYSDGNWYQGPWRGEHASDANSPYPIGRTGGDGGTLIDGVKEIARPEAEYFTTTSEQRSAGAPDQQTKYIVKDTDGNTLNWEDSTQNNVSEDSNSYTINVSKRFLSSV